jgi:hypothetical protein
MKKICKAMAWGTSALVFLLLLAEPQQGWGEPVATILDNGDPANRVDLAILGDGYTTAEMDKYADDVQWLLQAFFAQEPFREYQRYFNVHRIDVISDESGADHPERDPPVFRDTALDATYNCAGIQRLICVDVSTVLTIAAASLPATQRDVVLVLVNDPEYGGSGGAIGVASTHSTVVELVLHELGHSFGLLADEYGGPPPPFCVASLEPPEPNATKQTERTLIKWAVWIDPDTPIPTFTTAPGIPGLYEGAKYCDQGLFRPTDNSKMRSFGVPFEQINGEQLIKRTYNWVSPIDQSSPAATALTLAPGQSQLFGVTTPAPQTHALAVAWFVDGQLQGTRALFTLDTTPLIIGPHTVEVVVDDLTAMVRNDPNQLLRARRLWHVEIVAEILTVLIDIKPGSFPNSINPASRGVIPVAILTTDTFDATTVDPLSVQFGPADATEVHGRGHLQDVDGDGDRDLVLHFATQATGIECGDTSVSLTGVAFDGQEIQGADSIVTVGCP